MHHWNMYMYTGEGLMTLDVRTCWSVATERMAPEVSSQFISYDEC